MGQRRQLLPLTLPGRTPTRTYIYVHIKGFKGPVHLHLKGRQIYPAQPFRLPVPQLAHPPVHLNVHLLGMDPAWARKSNL